MDARRLDRRSPALAIAGALVGGLATFPVIASIQADESLRDSTKLFIELYAMPALAALGAFVAAWCFHPAPRGWPFVRVGAALGAYVGWAPAFVAYESLRYYPRYTSLSGVLLGASLPLALAATLTALVSGTQHLRALREADLHERVLRRRLFGLVLGYHALAFSFGAVAIPQSFYLSSRGSYIVAVLLPYPFLLFGWGSLRLFRSIITPDSVRSRRDVQFGAALQAFPLFLIFSFSSTVTMAFLLRGTFTYQDPYYQTVITDPTLFLTPFLGFGVVAWLAYIIVRHGSEILVPPAVPAAPGGGSTGP